MAEDASSEEGGDGRPRLESDIDGPAATPRPAAVTFATTEHFTLQTARGATIAETTGRASLFLGAVSAGLVAFAFAGQTSLTSLYVFGLALFPVLFFLGLVTFRRALQASVADTLYLLRINRLRQFYLSASSAASRRSDASPPGAKA